MRTRIIILTAVMAVASVVWGAAKPRQAENPVTPAASADRQSIEQQNSDAMRVEGEHRFRVNCSRCHAAPHRFPPRMMATIVRHMRVRATITDEDMRLILFYMTE